MSLKNVDIDSALRRLADKRIEDAIKEGKFDNLAGSGQPLELEPIPADENARMMWWALRIMRQNDVIPEEVRWRKAIDHLKRSIDKTTDESALDSLVARVNELVHKVNTLGTNALKSGVAPLSPDEERQKLRARLASRNNSTPSDT